MQLKKQTDLQYAEDIKMEHITLKNEFIKLGQALKAAGLVQSGVEAKVAIQEGKVQVNGTIEYQRGKKLHGGDRIDFQGEQIIIHDH